MAGPAPALEVVRAAAERPRAIDRRLVTLLLGLAGACASPPAPRAPPGAATAWPEADRLFTGDAHWVGADDAYSVDLGHGRVLWLFADTLIDPSGRHTRQGAVMIRNSVAIQDGYDPSRAQIAFTWGRNAAGAADSFFAAEGDDWFWPGDGERIGDRLAMFLMRVRASREGLGFAVVGWQLVLVHNPDQAPAAWRMERISGPATGTRVVGSGSVLAEDGFLYACTADEDPKSAHALFVARWPLARIRAGDLGGMEWWSGPAHGFSADHAAVPILTDGQTEFTIHRQPDGWLAEVQGVGFGPADIALRTAPGWGGPWSEPTVLYSPPEKGRPKVMIYAAKAHPHLRGADLVLTYATNSFDFGELFRDHSLYYPRFVRR